MSNPSAYFSNRSSCFKPCSTVIRCRRPRTHRSATSTFGATRSRLCLLRPCTTEKHTASSNVGFRPGDLVSFLLTLRSILLNVSVFQPFRTSTISSITTVKRADTKKCLSTSRYQRPSPKKPPTSKCKRTSAMTSNQPQCNMSQNKTFLWNNLSCAR